MEHRQLGRTGVSVSKFCLGAMMFGAWGNPDHDESIAIIHAALDAGINFIDTADVYGAGESEEIVGKALKGRRDDVVLATKFHNPMGEDPNRRGNSRRWIMRAVEDSLRRLQTDWIDLYQVHRPDPGTDIDETLAALTDLVRQGKVRYIGASTFPASARSSRRSGSRATGSCSASSPSSRPTRSSCAPSRPTCCPRARATAWPSCPTARWPAAGCRAAGARTPGSSPPRAPAACPSASTSPTRSTSASSTPSRRSPSSPSRPGLTLIQLAIGFVLNHPAITAALIGPRTMEQLETQLAAADVTLDDAILDRIDEIVAPGTTINPADNSFDNPALAPAARRRREAA